MTRRTAFPHAPGIDAPIRFSYRFIPSEPSAPIPSRRFPQDAEPAPRESAAATLKGLRR